MDLIILITKVGCECITVHDSLKSAVKALHFRLDANKLSHKKVYTDDLGLEYYYNIHSLQGWGTADIYFSHLNAQY